VYCDVGVGVAGVVCFVGVGCCVGGGVGSDGCVGGVVCSTDGVGYDDMVVDVVGSNGAADGIDVV